MNSFLLAALSFNQALLAVGVWRLTRIFRRPRHLEIEIQVLEGADGRCLGVLCPSSVTVRFRRINDVARDIIPEKWERWPSTMLLDISDLRGGAE
ncbi:MAG: hypothetical protein IKH04_12700 [Kiritimatiellae bacterium]|nr:hypothetical protein [Kiritimatiellia bacterium]